MTERELREIKRRFRPDRSNISKIVGCFVNTNKEIISRINQSLALEESIVSEKLLGAMKKTLSGSLGTNLVGVSFSTSQVLNSEEHKLLMGLVKTNLEDSALLEKFYSRVIESVSFETNYVILLACDIYDVPTYSKDEAEGDSSEVFTYVIASICPVKNLPEAISFKEADSLFHALSPSAMLSSPELGFMFPSFDDRKSNIYSALYYTRSLSQNYSEFTKNIFATEPFMPPKTQKATFDNCLSSTLCEECSFDVVRSVHREISEMIEEHKASKAPEPLTITKPIVKNILANCGVDEEKLEALDKSFDESFGKNAELTPRNIVSTKKFELTAPEVSIKVSPEHRDIISTQVINNVKYVMIRVDGGVEVNGISINIDDN